MGISTCDKSTSSPPDTFMFPGIKLPSWGPAGESIDEILLKIRDTWLKLRADYSRRQLSHHGDKLRAISANLQRFMASPDGDASLACF